MSIRNIDISIFGGGIAGLATATALAQRGADVTVLEQSTVLGEVGAGLQISPNGVAVLAALGLKERAAAVASVPEAVELRDMATGSVVAMLPMGRAAEQRWGRPYWQFHRADLLAVLEYGALAAGVDIQLGHKVESIKDVDAAVIIAADGVRSNIRAEVFEIGRASCRERV